MYKKSKKLLAWSLVVCMILTNILFTNAFAFERISGSDRYETAAEIALDAYESTDTAILATGLVGADALAAAPLAAQLDAPILLTAKNELPDATLEALEDLGVENVVVIGGKGAVSEDVVEELEDLGYSVERIAGADRFETSLLIAKELDDADAAFLVNGIKTADALSVSSIAAALGMPILLTAANNVSEDIVEFLADMDVYVVGGKAVVSDDILEEVDGERIAVSGGDRFDTNIAVIEAFADDLDFDVVYVASALDAKFADALAGGPLAALTNSAVLLVGTSVADATADFVEEYLDENVVFIALGGTASVSNSVLNDLEELAGIESLLSIKSVEATTTMIDYNSVTNELVENQKLGFTVNKGKTMTLTELANEGYEIEFKASKAVFEGGALTSDDGKLDNSNPASLEIGDTFDYYVVISKDGVKVESDVVEVEVIDLTRISAKITGYELVIDDGTNEIEISSGKLTLKDDDGSNEVRIQNVEGSFTNGTIEQPFDSVANYDNIVKYSSSKPEVASIDNSGVITIHKTGSVVFTIKVGDAEEKVSVTVVNETRKAKKAIADVSELKLANDAEKVLTIEVVDQFGDPFVVDDLEFTEIKDNKSGKEIASVDVGSVTYGSDDANDVDIKVTADASEAGEGNLIVKWDDDGDLINIFTLKVKVSNDKTAKNYKLEKVNSSDDFTLDLDPDDDDAELELAYNAYNADWYFIEPVDVSDAKYSVVTNDADVVDIKSADTTIVVEAKGEVGKARITVKEGETPRAYVDITVVRSVPTLSKITFVDAKITKDAEFDLADVIKTSNMSVKDAEGPTRIDWDGTDVYYIYCDRDNDRAFTTADEELATITYTFKLNDKDKQPIDGTSITVNDGVIEALGRGTTGTITIEITRPDDDEPFATYAIVVNIPK